MESGATTTCLNLAPSSFEVVMGLTLNFSTPSHPIRPFHKASFYSKVEMKVSSSDIFYCCTVAHSLNTGRTNAAQKETAVVMQPNYPPSNLPRRA